MTPRDEVETLLPFYLSGTLSGEELALVEEFLANDPDAAKALSGAETELAFLSEENENLRPSPDAFKRFSAALDKEAGPAVSPVSWLQAFLKKTFAVPAPLVWASAAAALAFIVVTAAGPDRTGSNDVKVAASAGQADAPFVLAAFKPDAKLSEISALLQASGAQFAAGPTSGGVFKIILPAASPEEYDRSAAALSASPLVSQVIPGRKPDAEAK